MNVHGQDQGMVPHENASINRCQPTILIISDAPARAQRIRRLLSITAYADYNVQSKSMPVALPFLQHASCALIILDAQNKSVDQLHALKQVRAVAPETHIMMVTAENDPVVASRALRAGVSAYIPAEELSKLMTLAIAKLSTGERYVSEDVMQGILHGMVDKDNDSNIVMIETLSDREMSVFQLLSHGKNLRTIADEIGINIKTVTTHCNNIRRKLQIANNHELCRVSMEWAANHHHEQAGKGSV